MRTRLMEVQLLVDSCYEEQFPQPWNHVLSMFQRAGFSRSPHPNALYPFHDPGQDECNACYANENEAVCHCEVIQHEA